MLLDLDIGRCHPLELPIDLDPLFLVDNPIMEYAGDLGGLALGRIRVKDDLPILQPLCCQWLQLHFANSSRLRCSQL